MSRRIPASARGAATTRYPAAAAPASAATSALAAILRGSAFSERRPSAPSNSLRDAVSAWPAATSTAAERTDSFTPPTARIRDSFVDAASDWVARMALISRSCVASWASWRSRMRESNTSTSSTAPAAWSRRYSVSTADS